MNTHPTVQTLHQLNAGDHITGTHFNVPFAGTVRKIEYHTLNHRVIRVYVDLDEPIVLFGEPRDRFSTELGENGRYEPSYSRDDYGCSINLS